MERKSWDCRSDRPVPTCLYISLGARSRPNWETHQWTKEWTDPRIAEETYQDPSRIKINNYNTRMVNQFCAFVPNEFKKASPEDQQSTGEKVSLRCWWYLSRWSGLLYFLASHNLLLNVFYGHFLLDQLSHLHQRWTISRPSKRARWAGGSAANSFKSAAFYP